MIGGYNCLCKLEITTSVIELNLVHGVNGKAWWNSKTIKNTVGEFFSENTNINNVNFIANYGVMTVNIVTNIIDIKEDMILCTITERYKPASDIYTIGYIYDPKAFVQLVVDTHGNIKVFGKHTVKGKLRIFLTYVLR